MRADTTAKIGGSVTRHGAVYERERSSSRVLDTRSIVLLTVSDFASHEHQSAPARDPAYAVSDRQTVQFHADVWWHTEHCVSIAPIDGEVSLSIEDDVIIDDYFRTGSYGLRSAARKGVGTDARRDGIANPLFSTR